MPPTEVASIGIFDSGIGGLSVWRELIKQQPQGKILYLADQANVPYGPRSLGDIRAICSKITVFFRDAGVQLIILACNTASAAALYYLRDTFPDLLFVGMEPALKPAAEDSRSGVVGVLATAGTFQGDLYSSLHQRFSPEVKVIPQICPGLVEMIELYLALADNSGFEGTIKGALAGWLDPLKAAGVDHLVLGCTHYPLIRGLIEEVAGEGVRVIDPSAAVARQACRLLPNEPTFNGGVRSATSFLSSGLEVDPFSRQVSAVGGDSACCHLVAWQSVGPDVEPTLRLTAMSD